MSGFASKHFSLRPLTDDVFAAIASGGARQSLARA